jgi:hypothetical protein
MPNPHLALAPPTIYWDSQSRASGGNAKVRAREYLTDAKIARLLHRAGAALEIVFVGPLVGGLPGARRPVVNLLNFPATFSRPVRYQRTDWAS